MEEKEVNGVEDKYIKWFSDLSNKDVLIVGGKGASLGEMFNNKFPVPPGFVITAQSFGYFINQIGLTDKIKEIIENIDFEDTGKLQKASKEIRGLIEEKEIPLALKEEILDAYHILGSEKIDEKGVSQDALDILKNAQEPIFVSVRSSATTEDLVDASFAGQQESFLNVKGDFQLIEHVKKCFSSLYTARAIYYRNKKGFKESESLLAVVVQKMIDSEKSGVIFSRNPLNLSDDIVAEAVFGLGEGIVAGKIRPDHYVVSRDLKIKSVKVEEKKIAIVRNSGGQNATVQLSPDMSKKQVLTNGEILGVADLAVKLEDHYKKPQDIEFAIEAKKIYIVQSRPITTKAKEEAGKELSGTVILEGLGASPGIGVGTVKIVEDMGDLSKIKKGDVLVTKMTNPDMVVSMEKSVAIITDEGGMTSHASIVSREMGIPAIVGTGNATEVLKEGTKITVDGSNGKVYEGEIAETQQAEIKPIVSVDKVKLKVIVDLPEFAERAAKSEVDSIGLTRLEGIIASMGTHPLKYEKDGNLEEYTKILEEGITKIIAPFKMMWIRTSDIRTDEYSSLKGAPEKEINPMMGLHGIRFSLKHPKIFEAELEAIKRVAEKNPDKKIGVMFPLVILLDELKKAKEITNKFKTLNMQIGVMIETPAAVQIIDQICDEGIDFISFGTNDLTQFTLGVDRGEDEVQYLYDETHPAVLAEIKHVIEVCKQKGVETSICGQAGSRPEMVKNLFKWGIDSISLNADAAFEISTLIKKMEEENVQQDSIETKVSLVSHPSLDNSNNINNEGSQVEENKQDNNEGEQKKNPRIVNCGDCGDETKLPFKPRKNRDYYCKTCFAKRKSEKENINKNVPGTQIEKLPDVPGEDGSPVNIKDVEKYEENQERLLNEDNIKYSAEIEERGIKNSDVEKAQDIAESYKEDIGSIAPIENLDSIEEKAKEIHEEVEKVNKKEAERYDDVEDSVKIIEEPVGGSDNESIGVYNPDAEDNSGNSPPKYKYGFDEDDMY